MGEHPQYWSSVFVGDRCPTFLFYPEENATPEHPWASACQGETSKESSWGNSKQIFLFEEKYLRYETTSDLILLLHSFSCSNTQQYLLGSYSVLGMQRKTPPWRSLPLGGRQGWTCQQGNKAGYYWGLGVLVEEGRWNVRYLRGHFRAH